MRAIAGECPGGVEPELPNVKQGDHASSDHRTCMREQVGRAVAADIWGADTVLDSSFAACVDSANVAGRLSGRRCMQGMGSAAALVRREVLQLMETLVFVTRSVPIATEWVYWLPREYNQVADSLATAAIESGRDRVYVHGHAHRFRHVPLVTFSDAGCRREGAQSKVGMGWIVVARDSFEKMAVGQHCIVRHEEVDISLWELGALSRGLTMLAAIRRGAAAEWVGIAPETFTTSARRSLRSKLQSQILAIRSWTFFL